MNKLTFKKVQGDYITTTELCDVVILKRYDGWRVEAVSKKTGETFWNDRRLLAEAKKEAYAMDNYVIQTMKKRQVQKEKEESFEEKRETKRNSYKNSLILKKHEQSLLSKRLRVGSIINLYLSSKAGDISEVIFDYLNGYEYDLECESIYSMMVGCARERKKSRCEVEKIVELSNKQFDDLTADLMVQNSASEYGFGDGGSVSDYKPTSWNCSKEMAKFTAKENNFRHLVTMVTSPNRLPFFVEVSGYNYIRNAGVYFK